jgi:hypothetical protein
MFVVMVLDEQSVWKRLECALRRRKVHRPGNGISVLAFHQQTINTFRRRTFNSAHQQHQPLSRWLPLPMSVALLLYHAHLRTLTYFQMEELSSMAAASPENAAKLKNFLATMKADAGEYVEPNLESNL